ncbi:pilus assembly PilX N-terminal domain-containing protein [Thermus thalpophilus]|uniref:pilus assembly PilX N-terminal domain-containing protein n=1 Tax=Thermus thalpophilus TaxID=2908147 RepID=UPI001FAA6234|nr:pilus assembly PilX N-terminal domain-containing protein [Thermus thalpophilus]
MRKGFALVSTLILLVVLMSLLTAYFVLTRIELGATTASVRQTTGFYAAEAGLNLRAEEIRQKFLGYNRPTGTSPTGANPCQGTNQGSGDFQCKTYSIGGRTVRTYVVEAPNNPQSVAIPPGELYEGLEAQEYRYSLFSVALGVDGNPEAILELRFKSRLVPMFQFAAFYNKDLEILPGPDMTLNGRVHTNGDLYLNAGNDNTLTVTGQVSTAGALYRGRKDTNTCTGTVRVYKADGNPSTLACNGTNRRSFSQANVAPWGGRIQVGVNRVTVPEPEALDPEPGRTYWEKADLRIGLDLSTTPPVPKVYRVSGGTNVVDVAATTALQACIGAVSTSNAFYNWREEKRIQMLDVDLRKLLDCIHNNRTAFGFALDDDTDGGLVFHFTVFGPQSNGINNYGVRVKNGAEIASTISSAPRPRGLTIATDQAVYIQGDLNKTNWIPTAFLADSLNILSNAWNDDTGSYRTLSQRVASNTEINAAFLAGTDITGGSEGTQGQDKGNYNGGLENYPRFHETWTNKTLTYRGSFVSLGTPRHVAGKWCGTGGQGTYNPSTGQTANVSGCNIYDPPVRNWSYDTRFSQGQLPPLSPRFVYLKQELFLREFERSQ